MNTSGCEEKAFLILFIIGWILIKAVSSGAEYLKQVLNPGKDSACLALSDILSAKDVWLGKKCAWEKHILVSVQMIKL